MSGNERADGPDEDGSGGVPPADRLAHLGHIEHPAQMYAIMKPVPNNLPEPADADEWVAAFGRVVTDGNLPGSDGKTREDFDPQGSASRWALRPEAKGMRCGEPTEWGPCRAGIGEPAANCPNTSNHPSAEQA